MPRNVPLRLMPRDLVPVGLGQVSDSGKPSFDAGIVDGVVEMAEGPDRVVDHPLYVHGHGDVGLVLDMLHHAAKEHCLTVTLS
jgi:hypothetical protein